MVGIGASAGGLEALEGFFSKIPLDSDIAFVVIQHLDPHHDSMMASLLKKQTELPIQVIQEGTELQPNKIYLNPPDKNVALANGSFQLSPVNTNNKSFFRIDHFFRSLAEDQGSNAICIVLSGTGSDGTIGLREIKSTGGMTMAQEEQQAEYGGMPQSAIKTGLVDVVLPIEKMAEELIQYSNHPYMGDAQWVEANLENHQETLHKIFNLLYKQTGHDFSNYKLNTIYRRIERRMAVHQIEGLTQYFQYLQQHKAEVDVLFKELLITVTSFFRDKEAFELLKTKAVPDLLDQVPEDQAIRVWVPGCATGEEAYSIAMILVEQMEAQEKLLDCKIFAGDIDIASIEFARQGVYPESIKADLSQERLDRFFTWEDHQYRIKKRIRDMVVFANQNLIKDPPFFNVHLISCRNVLIYMNQEMHKKLFPVFYQALKSNGLLFLGSSETVGGFEKEFRALESRINLFRKQNGFLEKGMESIQVPQSGKPAPAHHPTIEPSRKSDNKREKVEQTILENYTHPCVLINETYEVLFIYGNTEPYLTMPKGKVTLNIMNMARKNLQYKLISILRDATNKEKPIIRKNLRIQNPNGDLNFDLIIHPLESFSNDQRIYLVVFKECSADQSTANVNEAPQVNEQDHKMALMERELQAAIEQLEISNEELQSKNEELQATNEELQSSLEELETSKEEAQSTNEELISVNTELKQKVADLAEASNDINNLLASTEIATIFLDKKLRIKRFTPAISSLFNVIQSDIGRPISDITSNINYENLYRDASHVLDTLEKQEKEIQTGERRWYIVRVLPYRTTENIINGVVITFVDITESKLAKKAYRLAAVVQDSNDAITVQDLEGRITAWNHSAERMYGYSESEAMTMKVEALLPDDRKNEITDLIQQIKQGEAVQSFETQRLTKKGQLVDIWLTMTPLIDNAGNTYALATTEHDYNRSTIEQE